MALVSLDEFKRAIGETDASRDNFHSDALAGAEQAVINFAERDFGVAGETETRDFPYDGSGYVEIDDATAITAVSLVHPSGAPVTALTANQWIAKFEGVVRDVFTYLEFPVGGMSPEMGFMFNLDQWTSRQARGGTAWGNARVTATFGWPEVPEDVQRAVIWTAQDFEAATGGSGGRLTGKTVADVSEQYAQQVISQQAVEEGVPQRAQALLEPYKRHSL